MANAWRLLVIASCSLALASSYAFANKEASPVPNLSNGAKVGRRIVPESRSSVELATSASMVPNPAVALQPQPSIYHSIIDKTASSTRMSSPIQSSSNTAGDLHTAAGHHHGHAHGKYYEYREVPKKKTWKFGYKRGNHKHHIERHEHGQAGKHPHFKTKVKWSDKKSKGKGIHLWDYNHHDKKHHYG